MMPRSCLEIRRRHHVKSRWQSLEDMRAPGVQAGRGEPGPGGRGWGVGGAEPGRGEGTSGGSDGLGEERRSGEEALELRGRGFGVRVGDAERPSQGCRNLRGVRSF